MNMNMDSSWLGFSLSNNPISSSSDSSQLCLFEAFTNTTTATSGNVVVDTPREEGGATNLSIFTGSPKLEDFLGGSCTSVGAPPHAQPQVLGHFSPVSSEIYDSELKTIAASFLRGFANESKDSHKQPPQNQLVVPAESTTKKAIDTFGQRTSIYRGVTRHRWTGRYEAHLWDNSCRREGQSRKGRQGGYDKEEKAARAYDLAALKYWGPTTTTNFYVSNYEKELEDMKNMTRQEFVASLRRKSSGFSRGASIYRGVTRHHQHGRWQARIGRVAGNKDLYLGTFSTQEEAAEAYDIAAIKFRGLNAVTNFDMSRYDVKSIANSNLPIGGINGKSKNSSESAASDSKSIDGSRSDDRDISSAPPVTFASHPTSSNLSFAVPIKQDLPDYWSSILGYQTSTSASAINNAKNNNFGVTPTLFQSFTNGSSFQSPTTVNMELSANSSMNERSNVGLYNNGGYAHQQQSSSASTSSIPFATPIFALNSTNGNNYEIDQSSNGYNGSWISPSLHGFQSAKSNVCVFQTPIFGME
ncbi:hypothetical protein Ddye_021296 [Dipteronia dyeriana]|uniref:AP2/ERF domain-containing protein n=1 Tax=Dipteronia dyeriana TaxID=168575 RepID=A0AAD9U257_9ROSI|nr:hypothetical protein Ddye_021296 [Dipteronia dyeriana]